MRVLLCLHHRLDPNAGAPGVTLALGDALESAGCEVGYLSFEDAYRGRETGDTVGNHVRFPWRAARHLRRRAEDYDVVDATTGDAWVWGTLGRPGAPRAQALITRAHGLEHVADESTRRAAREVGPPLSWKYPLYHGGFRLFEVKRSLAVSDHCILLNAQDRDYARDRLGIPEGHMSVVPNGIAPHFHEAPPPETPPEGPLGLAFVGGWTTRKGRHVIVEAMARLAERGVDFTLSLLGVGDPAGVLDDFPAEVRSRVSVTPAFRNEELPELLRGREILVFPSLFEGSSLALIEAMACGLAPVATTVGAAREVVEDGGTGVLLEPGDADAVADKVAALARDRGALLEMRRRARTAAGQYRWDRVAARTIEIYERALRTRVSGAVA